MTLQELSENLIETNKAIVNVVAVLEKQANAITQIQGAISQHHDLMKNHNDCIGELQTATVELQNAVIEVRQHLDVIKNSAPDTTASGIILGRGGF
ncbi:MAG: hypothetical protein ACRC3J_09190 [Culicoidibacterales bacterium]